MNRMNKTRCILYRQQVAEAASEQSKSILLKKKKHNLRSIQQSSQGHPHDITQDNFLQMNTWNVEVCSPYNHLLMLYKGTLVT